MDRIIRLALTAVIYFIVGMLLSYGLTFANFKKHENNNQVLSVQAKSQIVTCPVNLDCKRCDYRIITKSDGTMVCRLLKCRGCKQVEQPPTFTPYPTWTPVPTATEFEPLPYPVPSIEPYP